MNASSAAIPTRRAERGRLAVPELRARVQGYDWRETHEVLGQDGVAVLPGLLERHAARTVAAWYEDDEWFRSRIVMERHNFGKGEYKYFATPLPPAIQALREELYRRLVSLANRWQESSEAKPFPESHADFVERCRAAGQTRPTPLLLRYVQGDYNCLHQDLYGGVYFPLQVAILLSDPDADFDGGELVLTEQRPRMQSRARVVRLGQGDAAVFAVNHRPVQGKRGTYRVTMRHGVSTITRGGRYTLGIIFHDAT
jgi:hypothetical protein